jgi:hypothetical protein
MIEPAFCHTAGPSTLASFPPLLHRWLGVARLEIRDALNGAIDKIPLAHMRQRDLRLMSSEIESDLSSITGCSGDEWRSRCLKLLRQHCC